MKEVYAERKQWNGGIYVYVGVRQPNGRLSVMRPLVFEEIEEGAYIGEPALSLSVTESQQLMDELWRCGVRPTEGTGSAGSLAATERHLKDMQLIAKGLLKKTGVQIES
jgi:hypothetical protein